MPIDIRRYGAYTPLAFASGAVDRAGACDGVAAFRLTRGFEYEAETGLDADLCGGCEAETGLDADLRGGCEAERGLDADLRGG